MCNEARRTQETTALTVEIWSRVGLTRCYVLFFIKLSNRRAYVAGITPQPHPSWLKRISRNITDSVDGFLLHILYLILDRDTIYTDAFRDLLKRAGVKSVRLPPRSPNLNAYAERFVPRAGRWRPSPRNSQCGVYPPGRRNRDGGRIRRLHGY